MFGTNKIKMLIGRTTQLQEELRNTNRRIEAFEKFFELYYVGKTEYKKVKNLMPQEVYQKVLNETKNKEYARKAAYERMNTLPVTHGCSKQAMENHAASVSYSAGEKLPLSGVAPSGNTTIWEKVHSLEKTLNQYKDANTSLREDLLAKMHKNEQLKHKFEQMRKEFVHVNKVNFHEEKHNSALLDEIEKLKNHNSHLTEQHREIMAETVDRLKQKNNKLKTVLQVEKVNKFVPSRYFLKHKGEFGDYLYSEFGPMFGIKKKHAMIIDSESIAGMLEIIKRHDLVLIPVKINFVEVDSNE